MEALGYLGAGAALTEVEGFAGDGLNRVAIKQRDCTLAGACETVGNDRRGRSRLTIRCVDRDNMARRFQVKKRDYCDNDRK
jgi:hypothetical protein